MAVFLWFRVPSGVCAEAIRLALDEPGLVPRVVQDDGAAWLISREDEPAAIFAAIRLQSRLSSCPVAPDTERTPLTNLARIGIAHEVNAAERLMAEAGQGVILVTNAVRKAAAVEELDALDWERDVHWPRLPGFFHRRVPWSCRYTNPLALLNEPFDGVFEAEWNGWVKRRRGQDAPQPPTDETAPAGPARPLVRNGLFGIALSGGGQRAAIYSLGVCQALARHGLLRRADYLSSVSGGGYFNASLQAMAAEPVPYANVPEHAGQPRFGVAQENFPYAFPYDPEPGPPPSLPVHGLESPALWHVRKHAKLLGNRIGLLDPETWDTFFRWLGALLLAWVLFLLPAPAIVGTAGVVLFAEWDALGEAFTVEQDEVCAWTDQDPVRGSPPVDQVPQVVECSSERGVRWELVLIPPLATLGLVALVFRVAAVGRPSGKKFSAAWGVPLLVAGTVPLFWLLTLAVAGSVWLLEDHSTGGAIYKSIFGVLGGLSAAATSLGILGSTRAAEPGSDGLVRKLLMIFGGYILLLVLLVLLCWGLWRIRDMDASLFGTDLPDFEWLSFWGALALGLSLAILVATTLFVWNRAAAWLLNGLSIHRVYQDRLRTAWVISGNRTPRKTAAAPVARWAQVFPRGDIPVAGLAPDDESAAVTPYPLFCTTINIPGSRGDKFPERKGDSFVIAPIRSGSASTRWFDTADPKYGYNGVDLSCAITMSGAAFSPNMGEKTTRTYSILLTIFNARIGRWCPNPRSSGRTSRPMSLFLKEMFANPARNDNHIYLSDGGHFENLGLYELIRRRCKYVIAISADIEKLGVDDKHGNLANAIRLVREDFGVEIEMGALSTITRGEKGDMASAYSVGLIRYPLAHTASADERRENTGVIVVIKSGIVTGALSVDLLNQWRSNPDFPYTSTANQQFDQAQFESYRQLGYLAGRAVGQLAEGAQPPDSLDKAFEGIAARFAAATKTPPVIWNSPPAQPADREWY